MPVSSFRGIHQPEPFTLPTKKQEGVLWAVLYTLGHMRRNAWEAELRANPMPREVFAAELATM